MVFLAAGDDDVARVYERVGFARLATTAVAELRPPTTEPASAAERRGGGSAAAAAVSAARAAS